MSFDCNVHIRFCLDHHGSAGFLWHCPEIPLGEDGHIDSITSASFVNKEAAIVDAMEMLKMHGVRVIDEVWLQ